MRGGQAAIDVENVGRLYLRRGLEIREFLQKS
jgi:hypothetical protein